MFKPLKLLLSAASLLLASQQPAFSAEPVKFALCYDLTKAYTFITPQIAQAVRDYAEVLNAKGGIEGHPIEIIVQDHGNEPQRGIECYEKVKQQGAITVDLLSTPVSRAVLPRAMKDGTVMVQALAGRGDAVDGEVFKWVFTLGPTYWGQAANIVGYYKKQSGGSLKGKKIAFLYIDYPFGQEPIPILQELQKREGFDLQLYPYPLPGSDQSAAWSQIRRFQPDLIIHWGFSAMHVVATKEAKRNGVSLDKMVTVNWFNEVDLANIGADAAKGLRKSSVVVSGTTHPLMQQITKELYDKGKGNGDRKFVSDIYYTTGLSIYAPVFEAARLAIRAEKAPLTPEKMRKGLERLSNFNANGLIPGLTVTAKDHGGGGKTRIEMWDGSKWVVQGDWTADYTDLVWSTVKQHSADFAKSGK
ncbi:MAG: ABC transporter substrate-binding protein [Burkholderiaceae bacterium]